MILGRLDIEVGGVARLASWDIRSSLKVEMPFCRFLASDELVGCRVRVGSGRLNETAFGGNPVGGDLIIEVPGPSNKSAMIGRDREIAHSGL